MKMVEESTGVDEASVRIGLQWLSKPEHILNARPLSVKM
jgi:hypothetical protein